MGGLSLGEIEYVNSNENMNDNAELINEFKSLIAKDPIVSKKYDDWYYPKLNSYEYAECIFPFAGSWYLCNNGSSREHNDCIVYVPYTSEEMLKLIRMEKFLDKRDMSFYKECPNDFVFRGGYTL